MTWGNGPDPLDHLCDPLSDLKLLFWETTEVWQGRFRLGRKPWARAKGLDICIFRKNLTWECYSFANIWAMDLKLFGVLCLPKVRQMGIAHLGMRPVRTEAWGQPHRPREVPLLSSGHPCSAGSSSRKRPRPSASPQIHTGRSWTKGRGGVWTQLVDSEVHIQWLFPSCVL